ncbi:MAG TPA: L-threonine 3-dehydrogenase [Bacillales bacterium]|nr:L-threonine 3-dehydrogenase [Bacillales bacterium]
MEGKMKALVKHTRGKGAQLQTVDIPSIEEDEVLVQVKATSICGTDVHIYTWDDWAQSRITPPYTFGHEFSGIVVETGKNVTGVEKGDHVSAETHVVCGHCPQCLTGNYHVCRDTKILGVDMNGCFSEYVAVPAKNIWKNSPDMAHDLASIQEPMGNAVHTVLSGDVTAKTVAVIGCGPIGLMAVGVAKAAGASKVFAFDLNDYRLGLAKDMGADVIVNSKNQDPLAVVSKETDGNGVDVICEMSGAPIAIDQAFKMVTNGGRVSILSLPTKPVNVDITNDIVFKGITVKGITGRKVFETWQQVSGFLQSGAVDVKPMLTHSMPLEDFEKGFDLMIEGKCGKVVLHP